MNNYALTLPTPHPRTPSSRHSPTHSQQQTKPHPLPAANPSPTHSQQQALPHPHLVKGQAMPTPKCKNYGNSLGVAFTAAVLWSLRVFRVKSFEGCWFALGVGGLCPSGSLFIFMMMITLRPAHAHPFLLVSYPQPGSELCM